MSFVLFIAVLVVLIVVHELGHFIVAKLFKIRVDEFGVGYPPRAFTIGKYKGTTYTINWLPFGGFVRIFGERHDESYTQQEKREAFVHKSRYVQAAVLVAGVTFNLVFAWFLFSATLMMGAPTAIAETEAEGLDTRLVISSIVTGSPADVAGLVAGDEIVAIRSNSEVLRELTPSRAAEFIQERPGDSLKISYIRDAKNRTVEEVPLIPAHGVLNEDPGTPAVGVAMALIANRSFSFGAALAEGFVGTLNALAVVTVGLVGFFVAAATGSADWSQVAGPVGIAGLIGDASSVGFVYLLYFTAFISVNLAVINLIPLPALDGGRLVFIGIEAITQKPIGERVANVFNIVGFALIVMLMVVITYHDLLRLLG